MKDSEHTCSSITGCHITRAFSLGLDCWYTKMGYIACVPTAWRLRDMNVPWKILRRAQGGAVLHPAESWGYLAHVEVKKEEPTPSEVPLKVMQGLGGE